LSFNDYFSALLAFSSFGMPRLSIITITYNAEKFLERTLRSVAVQTDQDFEYLLIDGGSKDLTLEIAGRYRDRVDVLVSEPDKGLYDAMNKGQARASGDYIWFMNAGDEIAEKEAVEKLKKLMEQDPDVIYSDTWMVNDAGEVLGLRSEQMPHKVPRELSWEKYNRGMLICHQSFIARRAIAPVYLTDNLSADIDWEIQCLKKASRIVPYPGILARYLTGGISHQQKWKSWKDRYKVLQKHFGFFPNLYNHFRILIRAILQ